MVGVLMKTKIEFNGNIDDLSAMLVSAERYAMGRQTYIVKWTCDFISDNLHLLTEKDKSVIIRDIKSSRDYGADFDKVEWLKLLNVLKESL